MKIAYFCMEIGLSESIPTYSGGLGILMRPYIKTEIVFVGRQFLRGKGGK